MKIYKSKVYDVYIEHINIKLSIDLDDFSNPDDNEGYIEITSVNVSNKDFCFWDNLNFFIENKNNIIKKECKEELINKNLYIKGTFKVIETLINTAISEKMLFKNDRI